MENSLMKSAKTKSLKILLIGIGNDSRGDDGLGWLFLDALKDEFSDMMDFEYKFQLQVEDADLLTKYDIVIFVDASEKQYANGFSIEPCEAASEYFYSSHLQSPQAVLYLAQTLYDARPDTYLIAISGKSWKLGQKPGKQAIGNLKKAIEAFRHLWMTNHFNQEFKPLTKETYANV